MRALTIKTLNDVTVQRSLDDRLVKNRITKIIFRGDVGFGSLADISQRNRHVRFTPKSGLMQCSNHATSAILREIFVTKLPTIFGV